MPDVSDKSFSDKIKELEKTIGRFESFLNSSPVILFTWNSGKGWPVQAVSKNIFNFQYSPDEFGTGKFSHTDIVHPDDSAAVKKDLRKLINDRKTALDLEYRIVTGDMRIRWISDQTRIVNGSGEKEIELQSALLDITKRKEAEEKLRKKERLLAESEELSKTGVWEYDTESESIYWTDEVFRIHDLPIDSDIEFLKKSFECLTKDDRAVLDEALRKIVDDGIPFDLEFPFKTHKNRNRWVRLYAKAARKKGKVVRVIGTMSDITERKKITEEKIKLSNIETMNNMIVTLNHEMNQPLSVICMGAEFALKNMAQGDDMYDELKMIYDAAWRLAHLVEKITQLKKVKTTNYLAGIDMIDINA